MIIIIVMYCVLHVSSSVNHDPDMIKRNNFHAPRKMMKK